MRKSISLQELNELIKSLSVCDKRWFNIQSFKVALLLYITTVQDLEVSPQFSEIASKLTQLIWLEHSFSLHQFVLRSFILKSQ